MQTKETVIPQHIIDIWQQIVDFLAPVLDMPCVMINRLRPPELEVFRSSLGAANPFPTGTRMPMEGVYCAAAAGLGKMLKVTDARRDPQWADSPTARAGVFAYLGFPLFWPGGEVFGTICTVDMQERDLGKKGEEMLSIMKNAIETHLALAENLEQLQERNRELERALAEVSDLRSLLPICTSCKKIRDDQGYWRHLEEYFAKHSEIKFSHGLCPECAAKQYPGYGLHYGPANDNN